MTLLMQNLTPANILQHWHTQGALWLMEDPQIFANHKNAFVSAIQQCTNTPEHQALLKDAAEPSVPTQIHQAVAGNVNAPINLLQQLAGDEGQNVRQAVAKNINTPLDTLQQLTKDQDASVQKAAIDAQTKRLQAL